MVSIPAALAAALHPLLPCRPRRVLPALAAGVLLLLSAAAPAWAQNSAPVITSPGDRTYRQAQTITAFKITVTDADHDTVTVQVQSLPSGLSYSPSTGNVSGIVASDARIGDYRVLISADDGTHRKLGLFTITIEQQNRVPAITDPGDQWYRRGQTVSLGIPVTDADDDDVTVLVSGLPPGLSYSSTTGKVSGTVASNAEMKAYNVRVIAHDDLSRRAIYIVMTVTAANSAPVITSPGDKTHAQGESITAFGITVTDTDGDTVTVGVSGLPSGLSYSSSTKQVSGTVAATAAVKAYTATITANDGVNTAVTLDFTVTIVSAANREPVITDPGNKEYAQGETITAFGITVTGGRSTTVRVTGLPSGLSYSSSTKQVSGTVASDAVAQNYTVTITVYEQLAARPGALRLGQSGATGGIVGATLDFTVTVTASATGPPASNGPPVITSPGDKTYAQGESITAFGIAVTDTDGDTVTVGVTGLPSGLSYSTTTKQVSGTVAATAAAQAYTVTVTANDGVTPAVSATFTITVTDVNIAPVITDPGNKTYAQGATITAFGITVTDADEDTVTVGVSGLPSGLSYSTATGKVSGTVAATAAVKAYTATITANDGAGGDVTLDFTVTVTDVNFAPVITDPGNKTYAQGETIAAFGITVTDADEDTVTVGVTGLPSGLSYSSSTKQVSGTVAADAAAQAYTATITANDGESGDITLDFTVTVTAANRQPVITDPGAKTYAQGETITAFGITVTDADEDTVTVGVSGLPSGLSYSTTTGKVSGTVSSDAAAQAYTATITANDGESSDVTLDFTVTVTAANRQPVITDPGNKEYAQGETITAFGIAVTDADEDTVTVGVSGLPSGLSYSTTTGKVSGTVSSDAAAQAYTVTVTASDGVNAGVTLDFTVTITATAVLPPDPPDPPAPNNPPVITDPGNKTYAQGETITALGITVTDADADDTVTVTVSGLPSGLSYSSPAGQVSGTVASDAAAQAYTVTVTASDGVNAGVTLDFTITVLPPVISNAPPVITDPGAKTYAQGEAIETFPIEVTDPENDAVTVEVAGLPSGLSYSSPAGQVSGTVAADAAAQAYTVTVTAHDSVNADVTLDFTVTVTAAVQPDLNNPPVITDPGDREYAQGEAIEAFGITVTDAEDDAVTVEVAGLPNGLSYSSPAGQVSGTVAEDAAAQAYTVTVTADDGVNAGVTLDFAITVTAPDRVLSNAPPVITDPGNKTYARGEAIETFPIEVTDPEDDAVTVEVAGLPSGLSYSSPAGQVSGTVAADAAVQAYTVTVTAHDEVNADQTLDFTITVTAAVPSPNPNAPPVITDPGNKTYAQGEAIETFPIEVTDPEDDAVTVGVTGLPNGLSYSSSTGQVSGTVAADATVQDYPVTISANDHVNPAVEAGFTTTITILDENDPGVRVKPSALLVPEGEYRTYTVVLRQQPTGPVIVTIQNAAAGVTVTPAVLEIAPHAWDQHHLVTVTGSAATTATLRHALRGGGYDGVPASDVAVRVSAADQDDQDDPNPHADPVVANGDAAGVVTLSTLAPLVAAALTAALTDADGEVAGERWQWERRVGGAWAAIPGATTSRYVPAAADVGARLRAAAVYGDAHGPDKRAVSAATAPVRTDPARRAAALKAALGAFGRTVASSAIDALEARFEAAAAPRGAWRATVGGQQVTAETFDLAHGAPPVVLEHLAALAAQRPAAGFDPFASPAAVGWRGAAAPAGGLGADLIGAALGARTWVGRGGLASTGPQPFRSGFGSIRNRFAESAFEVPLAADPAATGAGGAAGWTVWGRGDVTSLLGRPDSPPEGAVGLDGDVASGLAGADYRWGERGLLGVAVSRHTGTIDYDGVGVGLGSVAAGVTNVQPYARWAPRPGLSVWGLAGAGWGAARLADAEYDALETDLGLRLAAAGVRQELAVTGGVAWAAKADAFTVALSTQAVEGLPEVEAAARRGRVLIEGRTDWAVTDMSRLTPRIELGARVDGGSADRGAGLELGGGLTYLHLRSGLSVEGRARRLLAHQADGFAEWGASLTVRIDPGRSGRGLTFALAPVWGAAQSGVASLWGATRGLSPLGEIPGRRPAGALRPDAWQQEVGYGLDVGGRRLTPYATVAHYDAVRQLRFGARLGFGGVDDAGAGRPSRFQLEVMDERVTAPGAPPDHRFAVAGVISFGARRRPPVTSAYPVAAAAGE